jgi:membrane dipeptidase
LAATRLLSEAIVWDNHGCMPLRPNDDSFLPQLSRYRAAGVDAVFLNVGFGEQGIEEHVRMLGHFRNWLGQRPEEYILIDTVDDIERARATGRLGVGFDIEGAKCDRGPGQPRRALLRPWRPLDADGLQPEQSRRRRLS